MSMHKLFRWMLVAAALSLFSGQGLAQLKQPEQPKSSVRVAVATNFVTTLKALREDFESFNNGKILISAGSTGKLYAQIRQGAPYHIFLAADQQRPQLLERDELAVTNSRFTYASGSLVLWRPKQTKAPVAKNNESRTVEPPDLEIKNWLSGARSIAWANPRLAPYGFAAAEVLDNLGVTFAMSQRQVTGENIGQTFSLVATGNATLGFLAAAQMLEQRQPANTYLNIPSNLHSPILQDAVLLKLGANNNAAAHFMQYLASSRAQKIIRKAGFAKPDLRLKLN